MEKYSNNLKKALHNACIFSQQNRHEYVLLEHVLYFLVEDDEVIEVFKMNNASCEEVQQDILKFLQENVEELKGDYEIPLEESQELLRVRHVTKIIENDKSKITCLIFLLAMFNEEDSHVVYFLEKVGIQKSTIISYMTDGAISSLDDVEELEQLVEEESIDCLIDLTALAQEGKFDPVIGRKNELKQIIQTLCRRKKNNPLIVGNAGVGKSVLIEKLAQMIINNKVPSRLNNSKILSLDIGKLIAGTKFRGEFEKRFNTILKSLKDLENAILFIDNIHQIIGSGSTTESNNDILNMLKPALQYNNLSCIGITSHKSYQETLAKDPSFCRFFQKITINEISKDECITILEGIKKEYEKFHKVSFPTPIIKEIVNLSSRYLLDTFLPDKAIDLLDEIGASRAVNSYSSKVIKKSEVQDIIAKLTTIPSLNLKKPDQLKLKKLTSILQGKIYGQNHAIEQLIEAINISRAGLQEANKTVGSFLFTGPTGVGKTELSKQLALELGMHFIRYDMSEYQEKVSASKLIGTSPGYVGYEQGGLLTNAVKQHPYSVILFDEIEKSHPDIVNTLLQVMDYGKLTDNSGNKSDFSNTIIIATSNLGAKSEYNQSIGFTKGQVENSSNKKEIKKFFTPEFINRLNAIIEFNKLSEDLMNKIVDKFINQLKLQLKEKNITLKINLQAKRYLAKNGYDPLMGARPLQRLIQEKIKAKIGEEILFGSLKKSGTVIVSLKDNEIAIETTKEEIVK